MDYKEKYEEALERAREYKKHGYMMINAALDNIFPELSESEDEKIRNWLIGYFHQYKEDGMEEYANGLKVESIIAWLEKQRETFTKKDVDDAYLKGISDAKNEMEKQYEANYQTRKDIATFIFNYRGDIKDRAKWMDYLGIKVSLVEKQGSKPQGKTALEAITEVHNDNANKVEPKFKVKCNVVEEKDIAGATFYGIEDEPKFHKGDWIVNNGHSYLIADIDYEQGRYLFEIGGYTHEQLNWEYIHNANVKYHLWTIQDAKDGDVLTSIGFHNNCTFIFKGLDNLKFYKESKIVATGYCCLSASADNMEFGIQGPDCIEVNTVRPATKIQRDLLFSKMKEAGYEWDAEKKELKKIEQRSAWSEEDGVNLSRAIWYVENPAPSIVKNTMLVEWLKNLKERLL